LRREQREFHDCEVCAVLDDGTAFTRDLGRGVVGVMNLRRECPVILTA
jgi:hypothetical protein